MDNYIFVLWSIQDFKFNCLHSKKGIFCSSNYFSTFRVLTFSEKEDGFCTWPLTSYPGSFHTPQWAWVRGYLTHSLGCVVQSWVKFNPWFSKNYCSVCLSKDKITVLIKDFLYFLLKKTFIPKLQLKPVSVKLETRQRVKNLTLQGLVLIGFWTTGPRNIVYNFEPFCTLEAIPGCVDDNAVYIWK